MEGNACYKFSTIRNYITYANAAPIRLVIDIGANVGKVTRELVDYFPHAQIMAYEAISEYYELAWHATHHLPGVRLFNAAITSAHQYEDDVGQRPSSPLI